MRYCFRPLISILSILMLLAILSSCQKAMPPDIVAQVDGEAITVEEFTTELFPMGEGYQTPPTSQEKADLKKLKRALLDQLIEKRLVLAEAQKMGITVSNDEVEEAFAFIKRSYPQGRFDEVVRDEAARSQWKERLHQRLLIEKVINRVSQITSPIDEHTVRKYYKKHRSQFVVPEQVRVRQIVVKDRQEAEGLLGRIKRGEPFEELARRHSTAPEAEMGGDLGFFGRGDMPEEFDVVFSLKAGETSDIVQSPYGYHIFQIVARRGQSASSFDEVKDQVKKMVVREEEDKIFQAWLKKVKKRASVRVNKKALENIELPAPRQETQTPRQGTQTPRQETQTPSQGTQAPGQELQTPSQGTQAPGQGTQAPSQGTQAPSQGIQAPSQGTQAPSQGTQTPSQETQKSQ
ncbi:MAG: peptidylprolyl isomerase [Desulfobacterales bacterium]|nr:peptidylprolyl isomerase [Desulfobacterales bacterium]